MRKHSLGSKLHRLLLRFFFILLFLRVFADGERSAGIEVEASASTIQPDLDLLIPPKNVVARDLIDAWLEGSFPQ